MFQTFEIILCFYTLHIYGQKSFRYCQYNDPGTSYRVVDYHDDGLTTQYVLEADRLHNTTCGTASTETNALGQGECCDLDECQMCDVVLTAKYFWYNDPSNLQPATCKLEAYCVAKKGKQLHSKNSIL